MIRLTQGDKSHKRKRSECDPWLSDASASEDTRSSQIYKIISCILLYNGAKILFFYKIKRIGEEKMSQKRRNAWFWSRKKAAKGGSRHYMRSIRYASSIVAELRSMPCGRSIVLSTFKSTFNRLRRKFYKLYSKLNKKRCDGLYPYAVSSFKFLVSSFVTQISQIFWWYDKIYGKMSKTSFHNYS